MVPRGPEAHESLQLILSHSLWSKANKLEELRDEGGEEPPHPLISSSWRN